MLPPYLWAANKFNAALKKVHRPADAHTDKLKIWLTMEACPYIQPIICSVTRRLIGAEVLLYFKDKAGNIFAADAIINNEAFESFTVKLIDDIQRCFYPLRSKLPPGFFFTFNISASQITHRELQASACVFADSFNMMFEVNERSINEVEEPMLRGLQEMRDAGIQFAIDDFGAGCSGLKYLENMGFCMLKLNRDLTLTHQGEPVYKKTLSALSGLAIMLGIRLGAEGVESENQARCLTERGINLLQGGHYSRPLPMKNFILHYILQAQEKLLPL
jgi:EAL domain-containing protein (putative c-di-GMP-specific phosphodiesterase class I)